MKIYDFGHVNLLDTSVKGYYALCVFFCCCLFFVFSCFFLFSFGFRFLFGDVA